MVLRSLNSRPCPLPRWLSSRMSSDYQYEALTTRAMGPTATMCGTHTITTCSMVTHPVLVWSLPACVGGSRRDSKSHCLWSPLTKSGSGMALYRPHHFPRLPQLVRRTREPDYHYAVDKPLVSMTRAFGADPAPYAPLPKRHLCRCTSETELKTGQARGPAGLQVRLEHTTRGTWTGRTP